MIGKFETEKIIVETTISFVAGKCYQCRYFGDYHCYLFHKSYKRGLDGMVLQLPDCIAAVKKAQAEKNQPGLFDDKKPD